MLNFKVQTHTQKSFSEKKKRLHVKTKVIIKSSHSFLERTKQAKKAKKTRLFLFFGLLEDGEGGHGLISTSENERFFIFVLIVNYAYFSMKIAFFFSQFHEIY